MSATPHDVYVAGTSAMVQPGETCPTCNRRVNHERKPSSPTSRPTSYRVPVDELDAHKAVLDAAADHLGVREQPFYQFKTVSLALAALLQDASLAGFARRQP